MISWVSGEDRDKLPEIFEFRYRVFIRDLGWEIPSQNQSESDQFDTRNTSYLLWKNPELRGMLRLIPTTEPYMIQTLWPDLMGAHELYRTARVWEMSRLGIDRAVADDERAAIFRHFTFEFLKLAAARGIKYFIAATPPAVAHSIFPDGVVPLYQCAPTRRVGRDDIAAMRIECTEQALHIFQRRMAKS